MKNESKSSFPRWLFCLLAIGGLLAGGIFIGIMSVEGISGLRFMQAAGFTIFGFVMFWGALYKQ